METKKPINPSAFPYVDEGRNTAEEGMTLRDYFANSAMQGFISNTIYSEMFSGNNGLPVPEFISETAYGIADAMLKQRELNNE